MRIFRILTVLILLVYAPFISAQTKTTTINASSQKISIKDGKEGKTRYWNHLVQSNKPIVLHLAKNQPERLVTFYTDMDSISFTAQSENDYPLNVVYNSDTFTLILTTKTHELTTTKESKTDTDTIPFRLNNKQQIIIKGSVNNSPPIDFSLDLGARMTYLIGKSFDKSNKLSIDGLMEDESVTGLATEKTSSNNSLKIGNQAISNLAVCFIDEPGLLGDGGGLIGFNVFQDKIIEIDFDNQLLLIHKGLPEKSYRYHQLEMMQTTGGLYLPISISTGTDKSSGWYFFDTGADNALTVDTKSENIQPLKTGVKKIGDASIGSTEKGSIKANILELPVLTIANYNIENVPVIVPEESNTESAFEDGVIGILIQKRFNWIIDFPNNKMYLQKSKYFEDSFKKKENNVFPNWLVPGFLALLLTVTLSILFTRMKKK